MNYDITNTIRIFNSPEYTEERRKLTEMIGREFAAMTAPLECLIEAIVYHVSQPVTVINPRGDGLETIHPTPVLFIEQGLRYGLALGIFLERYREKGNRYDLTEVTRELNSDASEERRALMDEMRMHVQAGDAEMQQTILDIAHEVAEFTRHASKRFKALDKTVEIAMRHGVALGILSEQDRQLRAGRIV